MELLKKEAESGLLDVAIQVTKDNELFPCIGPGENLA